MSRRACVGGRHDTRQLPPNGFMFAPGVIEGPSRRRWFTPRRVESLACFLLVLAGLCALAALLTGALELLGLL